MWKDSVENSVSSRIYVNAIGGGWSRGTPDPPPLRVRFFFAISFRFSGKQFIISKNIEGLNIYFWKSWIRHW